MDERPKERSSAKREQIVRTGNLLFSKHGLRRVTVEEICREAGVSKMTFYKYFPNKLELFKHIWIGWSDSIYARLQDMEESGASFIEKMNAVVDFKMELLSKMNPALLDDILYAGPEFQEFIQKMRVRCYERFLEFVSDAQEKGEMRRIRPELLLAVLEQLGEIAKDEKLRRLYPTDIDFFREVNDLFFFGVMPVEKEHKK